MITKKRGRPPSATSLASATVNCQALASQVKQRIDGAKKTNKKIWISYAVRMEMRESVRKRNKDGRPTRQDIVDVKFPTAYTAVRKILRGWEKAKESSA